MPIDLNTVFWKINRIDYYKPNGVVKQMKFNFVLNFI